MSTQCTQIQIAAQNKIILLSDTFALRFFSNIVIITENTKYCPSRDETHVQNRRQRETLINIYRGLLVMSAMIFRK